MPRYSYPPLTADVRKKIRNLVRYYTYAAVVRKLKKHAINKSAPTLARWIRGASGPQPALVPKLARTVNDLTEAMEEEKVI